MPRTLNKPWLEAYLEYVSETEAPSKYRLWSGISALSSSLKRKVFVKRGMLKIFANQYIVLVGPPGVGKGTAMTPAIELVREANTAHFIEDRATAERIQEILANGFPQIQTLGGGMNITGTDHSATAVAPELSIFLGASDWSLQFLCTLWDKSEFTYDTKKSKTVIIKENCFGLLGACTPDYIRKLNKDAMAAVAGGFTSRTIFCFAAKKEKTIVWPQGNSLALKQPLVDDLRHISQLHGEMQWTKESRDLFADFYTQNEDETDEFESEVLMNFRARMWSHVVKAAMVLSISEGDDLIIKPRHVTTAINMVHEVFATLDITFRGVGESDLSEATDRIMRFIEKKGKCTRAEIMRFNYRHITDEDLERVLSTLKTIRFITEGFTGSSPIYTFNSKFYDSQKKAQAANSTPFGGFKKNG